MSVSIVVVRALVEAVEGAHVDGREFLAAAGFEARRLEEIDGRIEQSEYDSLVEHAVRSTGDTALGLRVVAAATSLLYSLVGHLVLQATTIREGLDLLAQYHRLISDERAFVLEEGTRVAVIKLNPGVGSPVCRRFRAEVALSGMHKMVQQFARDTLPDYVAFEHPAPPYRDEYKRIFSGRERFDQQFTGIVMDRRLLDVTQLNRDEGVHAALRAQAAKRMADLDHTVLCADKVREHVISAPKQRDMGAVAHALRISPRSLRRRLHEEGTTLTDVVERALASVAARLLIDERKNIQEVAHEIGFSEASAFCRAFKRWTGSTPKQFQATHTR
jgi:AraC-like DNA-binding protein